MYKVICKLSIAMVLVLLLACESKESEEKVTISDHLGRKIELNSGSIYRVIGLSPGISEILAFALPDSLIVGRTIQCDYPESILEKEAIESYPLDLEALLNLEVDLAFAEPGIIPMDITQKAASLGIPIYFFEFKGPSDILKAISALDVLMPEFSKEIEEKGKLLKDSLISVKYQSDQTTKVLGLISTDPMYVYGYNSPLTKELSWIGAENVMDSSIGSSYPEINREYLLNLDPDFIIGITPEEFENSLLMAYPELSSLKAYSSKRMGKIDPDVMTRNSPRVVDKLKLLKKLIYEGS